MIMVGPRQRLVVGEMLFDHRGAEQLRCHERSHRFIRQGMVRIADEQIRVGALEPADHAQMGIAVVGRVIEYAMQQYHFIAARLVQCIDGNVDFSQRCRAGGQGNGLFLDGDPAQQGNIGDIRRCDFEKWHQRIEKFNGLIVKRGRQKIDPGLAAMLRQRLVFIRPEAVVFLEQLVLAERWLLAGVPIGGRVFRGQGIRLVALKLGGVGPALLGQFDQAFGLVHRAFVIDADFGDQIRASAG